MDKCCNWKLRLSERQLFQQQKKKSRCPCLEGISQFCVTAALLREKKFLLCLCPYMGKNLSALPRNNIPPIYQQSIPPQNLATIRSFTCQFMYTRVGHAYAKYADYAHMRNMRIENLIHIFHIQREKTSLFKRQ